MDANLLTLLLNGSLFLVFMSIAVRAFVLYMQLRSPRLCILGLSMCTIALTAAADTASGDITSILLNTDWFLYIGQAVSLGYLFLSLFCRSDMTLRRLFRWQMLASVPVLLLLLAAPVLPAMPNVTVKLILSGSRFLICFLIFSYYAVSFIAIKETLFGFLMSVAFFLLTIGYFLILPGMLFAHMEILDQTGDIIRIAGVVTLLMGYLLG